MRIVALITALDEERFIGPCIEHLRGQGVDVHVTDNGSTDRTVEIAGEYLGNGVIGIDHLPRGSYKDLQAMWGHAEELATTIDADWFMLQGTDEFRVSPRPGYTLADELDEADAAGFTAVSFMEFTFVPCIEEPDHDHPDFLKTMRWYYPYLPRVPDVINAWKRQPDGVDLRSSAGHYAAFPAMRVAPRRLSIRHYQWLSVDHAVRKYAKHVADPERPPWRNWRNHFRPEHVVLPPRDQLLTYVADYFLDASHPRVTHLLQRGRGRSQP